MFCVCTANPCTLKNATALQVCVALPKQVCTRSSVILHEVTFCSCVGRKDNTAEYWSAGRAGSAPRYKGPAIDTWLGASSSGKRHCGYCMASHKGVTKVTSVCMQVSATATGLHHTSPAHAGMQQACCDSRRDLDLPLQGLSNLTQGFVDTDTTSAVH